MTLAAPGLSKSGGDDCLEWIAIELSQALGKRRVLDVNNGSRIVDLMPFPQPNSASSSSS